MIKSLQQKVAALQGTKNPQGVEEEDLTVQISALEAEKSELKNRVTQFEDLYFKLEQLLAEKQAENANLKMQLEKVADEFRNMFREHSTTQSETVFRLKKEKKPLRYKQTLKLYLCQSF